MASLEHIKSVTAYPDINQVLFSLVGGIKTIFGETLIGAYLSGSLSYADFNPQRSDIDLAVILKQPASPEKINRLQQLHRQVEQQHPSWAERIECSYIPLGLLGHLLPPQEPRPYMGNGVFYPEAHYGNEWLINLYLLHKHSIALIGPDFDTLIDPVDIADVKEASLRDLHAEWQPKISDPAYLADSHQQSYLVLNLCRILYTAMRDDAVSKTAAGAWVQSQYPQWKDLVEAADNWRYGEKMERAEETIEFIKFVIATVSQHN